MPWKWKHRKRKTELIDENAQLLKFVTKLEAQVKLQLDMLYNANAELKKVKKRADANNKFDNDNLSNLNYKLRTPLNDIIGLTNLLELITADGVQKNYISFIQKAGGNLLNILNEVLFYIKTEYELLPLENKQINLKALLEELNTSLKIKSDADGVELFMNVDSRVPEVLYGDEANIKLIFNNLLSFIIARTGKGIIVTQARVVEKTTDAIVMDFKISTMTEIIADDKKEKLFVPFAFVDNTSVSSQANTGLELAIAKSLIACLGGDISFDSNKNNGTTFLITLRFYNSKDKACLVSTKTKTNINKLTFTDMTKQSRHPSSLSVLLADDNEINQKFVDARSKAHWAKA